MPPWRWRNAAVGWRRQRLHDLVRGDVVAGKSHCQREPERAPREGFCEFDDTRAAMEHAQVEREKKQHAENETNPMPGSDLDETEQ